VQARPSLRALARAWFVISTQSVGGGSATLFLIRRIFVDQMHWVSVREFTESWALSQLSPGIHLVAMAGLLGRQIAGMRGVVVSVAGMMVPASFIAAILSAFFGQIAQHPLTIAALAGITPIAAGMTIGLGVATARPMLQRGRYLLLDIALIAAAFLVLRSGAAGTLVVIVGAGVFGAVFLGRTRPTSADAQVS
jgi:chromate transporter